LTTASSVTARGASATILPSPIVASSPGWGGPDVADDDDAARSSLRGLSAALALIRHEERADAADQADDADDPEDDSTDEAEPSHDEEDDARDEEAKADEIDWHGSLTLGRSVGAILPPTGDWPSPLGERSAPPRDGFDRSPDGERTGGVRMQIPRGRG